MFSKSLSASLLLLLATPLLAAPAPDAFGALQERAGVPAPEEFKILSFGVIGTGCPPGSATQYLNGDKTAVTVVFSKFWAEAGPGISPSNNRRNCQLTFTIDVPPGFTFGVASVDYRGYYQLDSKVTASQSSSYYFQGEYQQASSRSALSGPIDGAYYTYRDAFDLATTVTSPCGKSSILNVNSDVRVSNAANRQGSGYIANDSIDTSFSTTLNFQWQRC